MHHGIDVVRANSYLLILADEIRRKETGRNCGMKSAEKRRDEAVGWNPQKKTGRNCGMKSAEKRRDKLEGMKSAEKRRDEAVR